MLNNEFPPLGGGQGVVHQTLLQQWAEEETLRFDVIVGTAERDLPADEPLTRNARLYRVPLFNKNIHHSSNKDLIRYLFQGGALARKLARKHSYDLCFAFSAVPAGAIALSLSLRYGIPYITRSPGVDIPGFEARYRLLYPILAPLVKKIWRHARFNIASSEMHLELMRDAEPNARFEMIHNGIDTTLFSPQRRADDRVRIVSVARLVKRKGIDILIRAFAKLAHEFPSSELMLIGTGDDEQNLKSLAHDSGILDRVHFCGSRSRDEMPNVYREAGIFVLPSWNEGMSNAALEALASGLPIIMSDVGGASELVTPGENGFLVQPGDVLALESRIRELLATPGLIENMGRKSRERAQAFEWSVIAAKYLALLQSR